MTLFKSDRSAWPIPDHPALGQSRRLSQHIRGLIDTAGGDIGFARYMTACLYEPGLGYYSAGSCKIGRAGDFITAPEISPLFARCLANQCIDILGQLEGGLILELGAGTGRMAADILLELERRDSLPEAYRILEPSADLKQRQQTLLHDRAPHLLARVVWLDRLPRQTFNGIILANEVLDALPVCRFAKAGAAWHEMRVSHNGRDFIWQQRPAAAPLKKALQRLERRLKTPWPAGYVSEFRPGLGDWLNAIHAPLAAGVILFIDYGHSANEYYQPQHATGRLLCHYRHRAHGDPFYYPGLQDISAPVDFTAVAEAACRAGLSVGGYTTQMYFLLANGLQDFNADINGMDGKAQTARLQQLKMLTLPDEMGERFKVIALNKSHNPPLRGFSLMDQRARL